MIETVNSLLLAGVGKIGENGWTRRVCFEPSQ